jgi:methyl-accepting chemotaxis protein
VTILTDSEPGRISLKLEDGLRAALDMFRRHRSMRVLAIVDNESRPIGLLREIDVRELLFNPFGHALLLNPGFVVKLSNLIQNCVMVEAELEHQILEAAATDGTAADAVILTKSGRFFRTLDSEALLDRFVQHRLARVEETAQRSHTFTNEILQLAATLSEAASRITALSDSLGTEAEEVNNAIRDVAAATHQSTSGLHDIRDRGSKLAQALENLNTSAVEAKTVRDLTHGAIDAASPQMKALEQGGVEIRKIVDLIQTIASKTNFLALNAQIEAARNNDAADGFVAVAGEIKQLARQARESALDVSGKVQTISTVVQKVLDGHQDISDAMVRMRSISDSIDNAVSEQSATSLVIVGYVEQAVAATDDTNIKTQEITYRTENVLASSRTLRSVSALLASSAHSLRQQSQQFVDEMRIA